MLQCVEMHWGGDALGGDPEELLGEKASQLSQYLMMPTKIP